MSRQPLQIGVLAVQGDFDAHRRMLEALGAEVRDVRAPAQLEDLDGLVIPGGESTTISKGMARDGLDQAVRDHVAKGRPILGSCAGMIVCDRNHLALADYTCRRNAFGRQLHSFEQDLRIEGLGDEPLRAVFIRAPWIEEAGEGVEILAEIDGHPVAVRDGDILAVAFHAELTDDERLHARFMAMCTTASPSTRTSSGTNPATSSGTNPATSSAARPGVRGDGSTEPGSLGDL
ncbi:MAG TPA: pyridoxal 5'-phosphate synthase glutaminase subunit PdxT [Solirubrobacterales bacterium]|nr:pyridoxal 5'-phosphate synthase glutaminase subunit PdxT [Solirubrobacterales bacterium]